MIGRIGEADQTLWNNPPYPSPRGSARISVPLASPTRRRQVLDHIRNARRPLVVSHRDPDPDSLGTALALAELFDQLNRSPIVAINEPQRVDAPMSELPGFDRVVTLGPELAAGQMGVGDPDTVFAVDTATTQLLGVDEAVVTRLFHGRTVVNIDHHSSNRQYGHVNYIDASAAAAAEVLWMLLADADFPVTRGMAINLQAGIVADTLGFQVADVSSRTLRSAAALHDLGGLPHDLPRRVLNARTLASTRLSGAALAAAEASHGGRIVWTSISQELAASVGASVRDSFSVSNALQNVVGADAVAIFYETTEHRTRVSLRSTTRSIKAVAEHFGGGGHEMAAGCTIEEPLESARRLLLARLQSELGL